MWYASNDAGMTTYIVATDSEATSETILWYLTDRLSDGDSVHAINSLEGGEGTSQVDTNEGDAALTAIERELSDWPGDVTVQQFVRGNRVSTDVLSYADECDADEIVVVVRERSPTGKAVFGSETQAIILNADRPVVCVPDTPTLY